MLQNFLVFWRNSKCFEVCSHEVLVWFQRIYMDFNSKGLCGDSPVRQQRLGLLIPKWLSILMPGINQKAILSCVHLYLIQTDQMFNIQNDEILDLKKCKLYQQRGEAGTCLLVSFCPSKFRRWRMISPTQLCSPGNGTTLVSLERWLMYLQKNK